MIEGQGSLPRRLPFAFQAVSGVGRLALSELVVGPVTVDSLELEVAELPASGELTALHAERFQRRRTRLRSLAVHMTPAALDLRVEQVRRHLAGLGITQLAARLDDGYISVRARAADGLAASDLSFRVLLVSAGALLRAMASTIRVHGHLPTPGPLVADRILTALFSATDAAGVVERPRVRGLCDIEVDLVGSLLWHLLPPSGWRLPAVGDIELVGLAVKRSGIEIAYGPPGTRAGELGLRPQAHQLAGALDLMHSVDAQLRDGHLDEAMRGYRALLAAGGPDQPYVLERILALAAARATWFFDGLELARQALGRWSAFPAAHATLASITLAQGDAREAATHLRLLAQLASGEGDDVQAALAALAGARLLRVLDPKAATQLYQLALEHDAASVEAADSLADRLADEQRWPELVRLVRARAAVTTDTERSLQLRLRLADVLAHHLGEPEAAQTELALARSLAPEDPAVAEMTATILATTQPAQAVDAWRDVARLADARGDHRTSSRAWAALGNLVHQGAELDTAGITALTAWERALELDPLQADAVAGLAQLAAARGDHARSAELYERLRGLGLPQHTAAQHEIALARQYLALQRTDEARASLRRATLVSGETAAEAHAVLAELAEATLDRDHAAAELDTAIVALVGLARDESPATGGDRLYTRAAQLAIARANLLDRTGQPAAASADYQRAHQLAQQRSPELARDAARTLLARSGDDAMTERRWLDALLATRPPPVERAALLVRRADVRRRERTPDLSAALADLHEGLQVLYDFGEPGAAMASMVTAGTEAEAVPRATTEPDTLSIRRAAYQLEAELLAQSGDQRARAQALASLARIAQRSTDRATAETAAAAAWLAADEPAAALPEASRAHASLSTDDGIEVPPALRRDVLVTLGEAAWRQRAWPDVSRAYKGLLELRSDDKAREGTYRYRLAVAAERTGDPALAVATLQPIVDDVELARATPPDLRGSALRLAAELAERGGDLASAAAAFEQIVLLAPESAREQGDTALADAAYRAGELYRRADRDDDAIRCFESALRISEQHLPALDALETAWRNRGDHERVSVILGRKVAATARHPARQKPLLSRLGDLQAQLGRPDVALAVHQRALEIDASWRPSLKYVTYNLRETGQLVAAAGGLAQLAAELPGDSGVDLAIVVKERQAAASALAELTANADDAQLDAIRAVALPVLERASPEHPITAQALARLRGDASARPASPDRPQTDEDTQSGKLTNAVSTSLSLRDAAARARAAGKLEDALATLEAANHVNPGDPTLVRELVDIATELGDHANAARHLTELAELHGPAGVHRGNDLLELADIYYDKLEDLPRARQAMRAAAEAFGPRARRDSTLRMLAAEASSNLAWDASVDALAAIAMERRTADDIATLARALVRAGRDADALALVEAATAAGRLDDGGLLHAELTAELTRKAELAHTLDGRAASAPAAEASELRAEAASMRRAIGAPPTAARAESNLDFSDEVTADLGVATLAPPIGPPTPPPLVITIEAEESSRTSGPLPVIAPARQSGPVPVIPARGSAASWAAPSLSAKRSSDSNPPPIDGGRALAGSEAAERSEDPPALPRTRTSPGIGAAEKPPGTQSSPAIPVPASASQPIPVITDPALAPSELLPAVTTPGMPAFTSRDLGGTTNPGIAVPPAARDESQPLARIKLVTKPGAPSSSKTLHGWSPSDNPLGPTAPDAPATSAAAFQLALASADRDTLISARRAQPDDAGVLLALLAHLGDREPALRREVLEETSRTASGRALAIALDGLAHLAREGRDAMRATSLWARAHEIDPAYAPAWMPLADALAASDDTETARELYERVAASDEYPSDRRTFAQAKADALGLDTSIVSGELRAVPPADLAPVAPSDAVTPLPSLSPLDEARALADAGDVRAAIQAAQRAADASAPGDLAALELLEQLFLETGDVTGASDMIGRQIVATEDPQTRAMLWRRRARLYRDALGRDADAFRCLKEAQALAPADPEIAYQLRVAAMVRGEWALAASLLYREIAAATTPRERGALHLELALVYEERLDDDAQAQVNFEQALQFDPTIPAAKLPLARRYEALGRFADAARMYDEAATTARAGDRGALHEAAERARAAASTTAQPGDVAAQLDRAVAAGDVDASSDLAHQLWRTEPGNAAAFRVLAQAHRAAGDLPALTDITSVRATQAETGEERGAAWLEVARLADELDAFEQAAHAYDQALVEDPGNITALDARGALAFRLGDYRTADLIYRDLAPGESALGDDEVALRRSIIAERLGRDTEALAHAQSAAAAAPGRLDLAMRVQDIATRIGDLELALTAARAVHDLTPLDDDEGQLRAQLALVDLMREAGNIDGAISQLDRIRRDHPFHEPVLEALAELHIAKSDWTTATRFLYQLVPMAPTPASRADRLYRLGEAVLIHLGDAERADDIFLRASDLEPAHIPTLRRLVDVYWRADEPGQIVEVASELADRNALANGIAERTLGRALVATALVGEATLAQKLATVLGESAAPQVVGALTELEAREGRMQVSSASTAITELARRGVLDLAKLRAAAAATSIASAF